MEIVWRRWTVQVSTTFEFGFLPLPMYRVVAIRERIARRIRVFTEECRNELPFRVNSAHAISRAERRRVTERRNAGHQR